MPHLRKSSAPPPLRCTGPLGWPALPPYSAIARAAAGASVGLTGRAALKRPLAAGWPCDHIEGTIHEIVCSRLITKADIGEISLVRRPANTAARIYREGVAIEQLKRSLGPDGWQPGMPVSSDICLQPCGGLRELGEPEVAVDPEANLGLTADSAGNSARFGGRDRESHTP